MNLWTNPAARRWTGGRRADRRDFHARLPGYRPTPLRPLPAQAAELGLGSLLIKDESGRFGLPSFKILGASWAAYRALRDRLGGRPDETGDAADPLAAVAGMPGVRLLTATAGNHGRALARVARWLRLPALVLLPGDAAPAVVAAIAGEGAEVRRVAGGYDDAVGAAFALAAEDPSRVLVQDTAVPGHERVPAWVVEGYQTIFWELREQLPAAGYSADLVVVPVGVGSLAGAAVSHYATTPERGVPAGGGGPRAARPALLAVEPVTAACALASLRAGRPVTVPAGRTAMAGLNCRTVSSSAWPLLRAGLDAAAAVTDDQARAAQETLSGAGVEVGLCGAATLAAVANAAPALDLTGGCVVLIGTDAPEPDRPPSCDAGHVPPHSTV